MTTYGDSIYDKAHNDGYKNKLPYPTKPKEPAVLRKAGRDLTDDEIATLGAVRRDYEAELAAYRAAQDAYRAEDRRLDALFRTELEAEFGTTGHPKADKLFSLAWQHGHSAGYGEVWNYYSEFVELVDV